PEVAAAGGSVGLSDAGGVDGLPAAGAVLPAKPGGTDRGSGATPDGGVAAAGVPRVRSDPAADGVGSGGACHPAEYGASPHLAAVTLPDAGPIVGPSVSTPTARLTAQAEGNPGSFKHKGAENGPSAGCPRAGRRGTGSRAASARWSASPPRRSGRPRPARA